MNDKKSIRLLLVEDSPDDMALMLRHLQKNGYDIAHERVDTADAMQNALSKPWDAVICDYAMPRFDALSAFSVLRKSGQDLPFIIVSGTIGEETAVEAMRMGVHDYLMKSNLARLGPAIDREIREAKVRRQRAEADLALYQNEEKFRFMFEHNPVPMWVVDQETRSFLEVNQAAVTRYGYSRQEFLAMKEKDIQAPPSNDAADANKNPPDTYYGHRMVGEGRHRLKNGEIIDVETRSDKLNLAGKQVEFVIAHDISHRKQAERDLIKAREAAIETSRLKSEFLANMSHEIRTPLNGIIGMAEILGGSKLSHDQKDYVNTIMESANSLLSIVNDVLDFSKIETGKLDITLSDFNLKDLVSRTAELLTANAQKKKLTLKIDVSPQVPSGVRGDPERLREILLNLGGNAIKFTEQGQVTLQVETVSEKKDGVLCRFTIEDTGIGIPEEARGRLFQAFSQVDSSLTRKYGGTGLGLAICKQLVGLLGGEIGFESSPGKGSKFWFTMPLKKTNFPSEKQQNSL